MSPPDTKQRAGSQGRNVQQKPTKSNNTNAPWQKNETEKWNRWALIPKYCKMCNNLQYTPLMVKTIPMISEFQQIAMYISKRPPMIQLASSLCGVSWSSLIDLVCLSCRCRLAPLSGHNPCDECSACPATDPICLCNRQQPVDQGWQWRLPLIQWAMCRHAADKTHR